MLLKLCLISFFFLTGAIEDSDFFCKSKESGTPWSICRRCPSIDKKCDQDPSGCHCENIKVEDPATKKLIGGSDCNDGFCYVSQNSECSDVLTPQGYDPIAYTLKEAWHHDKIFRSKLACQSKRKMDTGNKAMMPGVKIVKDYLHTVKETRNGDTVVLDYDEKAPIVFYTDTHEECMEECRSRCGICGAWSYNDVEGNCYLHTADACCAQKEKQEQNSDWISGYFCIHCWSTGIGTECPCPLTKRTEGQTGCQIAQSHGGATDPQYVNPTGLLGVHPVPWNADPCACERRKTRRGCRCLKPQCKSDAFPQGTCEDQRRCFARKIRFPRC